eukprot:scaffold2090_cov151-Chaetoceros_neogracile.AAC.2
MSPNQMRAFGVDIDDCPTCFDVGGRSGRQSMKVGEHEIPFEYTDGLVLLKTRLPSIQELESCPILILTSDAPWNPNEDETPGGSTEIWDPDNLIEKDIKDSSARAAIASRMREGSNIHICNCKAVKEEVIVEFDPLILDECKDLPPLRLHGGCLIDQDDDSGDLSLSSSDSDSTSRPSLPDLRGGYSDTDSDSEDDESTVGDIPPLLQRYGSDTDSSSVDEDSVHDLLEYDFSINKGDSDTNSDLFGYHNAPHAWNIVDTIRGSSDDDSSDDDSSDGDSSDDDNLSDDYSIDDDIIDNKSSDNHFSMLNLVIKAENGSDLCDSDFEVPTNDAHSVLAYVERAAKIHVKKNVHLGPKKATIAPADWEVMRRRFGYLSIDVVQKTFDNTTQLAKVDVRLPLRRHFKSRFPQANVNRLHEMFATDTFFSSAPAIGGEMMCQLFVGNTSNLTIPYGMHKESEGLGALNSFINDVGAPDCIKRDNSKMQNSAAWRKLEKKYGIKDITTEPHNQQQNPAERRIQTVKNGTNRIMDRTGTPKFMWFECLVYFCAILNMASSPKLDNRNSIEVALGHAVDISPYICYEWWEDVYYLDYEDPSFPHSKEKLGKYCGPSDNCGDLLTFKIYVPSSHCIIHRSVLRSVNDDKDAPNFRAANPHYFDDIEDASIEDIMDQSPVNKIKERAHEMETDVIPDDLDEDENQLLTSLSDYIAEIHTTKEFEKYGLIPDPQDLIGLTFPSEDENGINQKAVVRELQPDHHKAVIELMDGSRKLIDYHLLLEKYNAPDEDSDKVFTFSGFLNHRMKKGKWELLVEWDGVGYEPSWEPLAHMKEADPISCASYGREHNLLNEVGWKWAKKIKIDAAKMIRLARRMFRSAKMQNDVFKFGFQVPRGVSQALALDKANGNNLWKEALEKEIGQLLDYKTFQILPRGERAPEGYTRVPLIIVFDVKHDGRHKARQVAGGHVTDPGTAEVYSSVVSPEGVREVIFIANHNGLEVWGGDVGNAYLNGRTREKVFTILGPEYGPKLAGCVAIIEKGLYGLKTSGARWSEHLADTLRSMGWTRCKALNDVWMRDCGTYYEYIAVYSDDIIVASKNPKEIYDKIQEVYIMKGVGEPEYFIGAEMGRVKVDYTESGFTSTWSAKTYLTNVIDRIEKQLGVLRAYTCPMDPDYHPELDETPLLNGSDISIFRMLIGCAQWAITLGRMDVLFATTMLSRYNMAPREGHTAAMKKLFGYLKSHLKGKITFDTREMKIPHAKYVEPSSWSQTYGDVKEELPPDAPEPKMKPIDITVYFDASFACDLITRRSVTGVIVFLGSTPLRWICKKQNTVETSTYGAEIVAGRLGVDAVLEFRYVLRMLGVPIVGPTRLLGDNMSVIQNCSLPASQLKKKHNAIAYHRIRESVAAEIVALGHVSSERNYSDIGTKALNGPKLNGLCKDLIFQFSTVEFRGVSELNPDSKESDQRSLSSKVSDHESRSVHTIE